MAQPTSVIEVNGVPAPESTLDEQSVLSGKRKRDEDVEMNGVEEQHDDEGDERDGEEKPATTSNGVIVGDQKQLVKAYYEVLTTFDTEPSVLKRPLPDTASDEEPQAKRQKSAEPPSAPSIYDKVEAEAYAGLQDMADDVLLAVKASIPTAESPTGGSAKDATSDIIAQTNTFKEKAMSIFRREKAYPRAVSESPSVNDETRDAVTKGDLVLSLVGYAPQERRLFSSLPNSGNEAWAEHNLPPGVSVSRVLPTSPQEKTQTLGELFAPPRSLPPLQPPKPPKTQAKGNTLDFYHPELADTNKHRGTSYFNMKLPAGHYLDYSNATPSWQTKTKKHERAQSLAGRKPSISEAETSEMEALFRGAFSSFAPCKDDSASLVPASLAAKMWWQRAGQKNFQRIIEVEYYNDAQDEGLPNSDPQAMDLNENAIQDAIDNWDDSAVDPSLEDVMGSRRNLMDKEADDILDEVGDMIETLASYQRIRNLTLPNSQNRQSSDPVAGDMLANSSPQPSGEEQITYQMLKAQLALIIKTLPPYAVAKLNGDQLDELLVSTKVQVQTDQYKGVMEEDEAGVQARMRAQQQAAAVAAAAQSTPRPAAQRTPSVSSVPYPTQYQPGNQYGTPNRTPSMPQQQYYRPQMPTPSYQQPRNVSQPPYQPRPSTNQYSRPNGYPNSYATQLAKAQTPYGHQNMQQYASQPRPQQFGQLPQQGNSNARFAYQPGMQQPNTPTPGSYGPYTNGTSSIPPRTMSPQVPPQQRQAYSPSPNMQQQQQQQRYGTPTQPNQLNRFPSGQAAQQQQQQHTPTTNNPGLTGYHTVIPEAQQQRIIDQAKARVAAQERSASFTDKISQPGMAGLAGGSGVDAGRLTAARLSMGGGGGGGPPRALTPTGQRQGPNGMPVPHKVTPVPFPAIPGAQSLPRPSS